MMKTYNFSFNEQYLEDIEYVENLFEKYTKYYCEFTDGLVDAYKYSLFSGGKRIRPIIMLETFKIFSDDTKLVEPFLVAIEMIHTYSLVHDDLPALDNDDLRRGKATLHKVYGEDIALLAGDALLNKSFELMSKESLRLGLGERGLKAISILSNKSGDLGMIAGQYVDVLNENKLLDEESLLFINEHKTSALLEGAFMLGAIISGQDDELINKFERIGKLIGLAFQIQDDILDVNSTTEELGKPVGSDKKNMKNTFVDIYGLEKSEMIYKNYYDEAIDLLNDFASNQFLVDLINFLKNRRK